MLETIKIAGVTYFGIIQKLDQDTNEIADLEKMHQVIYIQELKFTVMCNTMQEEFFPSFRINQDSLTLIFLWQKNSKYHQTWLKSVNLRNKIEPQHVSMNKLKNL